MNKIFYDINSVKDFVLKIPKQEILSAFIDIHFNDLLKLFKKNYARVITTEQGEFCSRCDYKFDINKSFGDDERDYHYCVNCLRGLLCCDDDMCDRDNGRLSYEIYNTLENFYDISSRLEKIK